MWQLNLKRHPPTHPPNFCNFGSGRPVVRDSARHLQRREAVRMAGSLFGMENWLRRATDPDRHMCYVWLPARVSDCSCAVFLAQHDSSVSCVLPSLPNPYSCTHQTSQDSDAPQIQSSRTATRTTQVSICGLSCTGTHQASRKEKPGVQGG